MRESPSKSGLTDLWETLDRRQSAGPRIPGEAKLRRRGGEWDGAPRSATPRHRLVGVRGAGAAVFFLGDVKTDILRSLN